ncbi:DUF481 domain-containing protein [candidate division KSB1 bacterium]
MRLFTIFAFNFSILLIFLSHTYAQVNIEKFRDKEKKKDFSGYVELDLSSRTGNVDITKINFENLNNYIWKSMNTFLVIRSALGWEDGEQYINEGLIHLRQVFRSGADLQPEIFAQTDYNKERHLSFRGLIGGGLRFSIYKSKKTELWWGTDIMQEYERLDLKKNNGNEKVDNITRWSNYLAANIIFNENVRLTWTTYFQPYISDFKDIRILSEKGMLVGLNKHLSLDIAFRMRYDSQPPKDTKSLDTALKTGLVLHF